MDMNSKDIALIYAMVASKRDLFHLLVALMSVRIDECTVVASCLKAGSCASNELLYHST